MVLLVYEVHIEDLGAAMEGEWGTARGGAVSLNGNGCRGGGQVRGKNFGGGASRGTTFFFAKILFRVMTKDTEESPENWLLDPGDHVSLAIGRHGGRHAQLEKRCGR